jgi:hypothetical protein
LLVTGVDNVSCVARKHWLQPSLNDLDASYIHRAYRFLLPGGGCRANTYKQRPCTDYIHSALDHRHNKIKVCTTHVPRLRGA